jgi:hypothetical protein
LDSAVFHESVFPHRKPGLLGYVHSIDLSPPHAPDSPPIVQPEAPVIPFHLAPEDNPLVPEELPTPTSEPSPEPPELPSGDRPASHLVAHLPDAPPMPPPPFSAGDLPVECPHTPPTVKHLTSHFEHHLSVALLPLKHASRACQLGVFTEANLSTPAKDVAILLSNAIECALCTSDKIELRTLAEALRQPDADKWVAAALTEIEAHLQNGMWELVQLLPGKRAIGLQWVFKVKCTPEGFIDKYKGQIVAQGYSQIQGIHYNKVFVLTAQMAAMHTVMAIAAVEDLELESLDVSMAFLNGEIDAEVYMRIPEGLEVEGDPQPGEDLKCWVVRLLKGLYGIKQGPRIWALKLHSVLSTIGFERINCDHSVYVY